jgi:hypothetical protein
MNLNQPILYGEALIAVFQDLGVLAAERHRTGRQLITLAGSPPP